MVFEVLREKYKCGCERGLADWKEEGILGRLNAIAEWDKIRFPKTIEIKEQIQTPKIVTTTGEAEKGEIVVRPGTLFEEDREFLGPTPSLKPGDMFTVGSMIFAIDSPNRLILVHTDRKGGLERVIEEKVGVDYSLMYRPHQKVSVKWETLEFDPAPGIYDIPCKLPYAEYALWIEKFVRGRHLEKTEEGHLGICCKVVYPGLGEIDLLMGDRFASFKGEDFDEEEDMDIMQDVTRSTISWFLWNFERSNDPLPLDQIGTLDIQRENLKDLFIQMDIQALIREEEKKKKEEEKVD